jgi:haloacetate dehalogenase
MFDGFALDRVAVGGGVELRVRHGGAGPPLVLLHGHPRTHATWHRVAPLLADRFTVVCPDLRGYGESSKPATTADHRPYGKRAMAADIVALLRALGHERFAVVGHDRGCYVASRTALDHPDAVSALGVLDGVPIADALARCDARFAAAWWHWFFLGQTDKPAERVINADPTAWYRARPEQFGPGPDGAAAYADYLRAIRDPATVHAMCEDYRAGLGVDRADDEADRAAGRRIRCPVLVGWAAHDDMRELYGDPVPIWRDWVEPAYPVRGVEFDSGHHIAEDAPEALAGALADFLHHDGP